MGLCSTVLGVLILFLSAAGPLRAADRGGNGGGSGADPNGQAAAHSGMHATTTTTLATAAATTATGTSNLASSPNFGCDPGGGGAFQSTCTATDLTLNGSSGGPGICAGCVGSADNKAPSGQTYLAGVAVDDANSGYECDTNSGVARTNPAHSGCKQPRLAQVTTATTAPRQPSHDVSITKTVDRAEARPGDALLYTVTVTNTGRDPLTGVFVTDAIPAGTTYVAGSANPSATFSGNSLRWDIGNVAVGASRTMTFRVTVNADAPAQVVNVAVVRSNETPTKEARVVTVVPRVQGVVLQAPKPRPAPRVLGVQLTRTGAALTMTFKSFSASGCFSSESA